MGRGWRPPNGPPRCGPSRPSSTRTSTNWPHSRWPTPDIRSATPSGRPATSATCCSSTRPAPERLSGKQIPVAGGLDVTFNEPLGVVGVITPWNFPMTIASWGFAPALAAGNAVLRQARRVDPADHDAAGRTGGRGGPARRPVPGAARQGVGGRGAVRHPPRRPQDRVHRVHRGRHTGDGGRRRPGQAGDAGTRRQERQHRLRRLRPGEGGGHRAVRRLRQRRSGLLCAQPDPGAAQRVRPSSWNCSNPRSRAWWSATRHRKRHRDGSAGVEAALGHRWPSYVPDDAPVAFRGDAPAGPGTGSRRRCSRRARTDRTVTEEIFGPVVTVLPFDDEADAIALANDTPVRPVRIDLDRQPVPGAAGVARGGIGQPVA